MSPINSWPGKADWQHHLTNLALLNISSCCLVIAMLAFYSSNFISAFDQFLKMFIATYTPKNLFLHSLLHVAYHIDIPHNFQRIYHTKIIFSWKEHEQIREWLLKRTLEHCEHWYNVHKESSLGIQKINFNFTEFILYFFIYKQQS